MGGGKKGIREKKKGLKNLRHERSGDFLTSLLKCWSSVRNNTSEKKRIHAFYKHCTFLLCANSSCRSVARLIK
jgi:hypothetical protein